MAADRLARAARRSIVSDPRAFRLGAVDPADTMGVSLAKDAADEVLRGLVREIAARQETLYAQDRWAVLLIFQAMDAGGKDSAIKHVFSGINPQGVQVHSFKEPSAEELDHDFLWRTTVRLPERGRIGVFNRSYYEEVLVVRLHPNLLEAQRLPERLVSGRIWKERFEDINAFELHLARSGYVIRKFFLHISEREQAQRFLKRLEEPEKRWKFSMGDVRERAKWREYMRAYADTIRRTSTPHAPWVVVPADRKWFARLVIARCVLDALEGLPLTAPAVTPGQERELEDVRVALQRAVKGRGSRPGRRRVQGG